MFMIVIRKRNEKAGLVLCIEQFSGGFGRGYRQKEKLL
jgi:hypothetical protein